MKKVIFGGVGAVFMGLVTTYVYDNYVKDIDVAALLTEKVDTEDEEQAQSDEEQTEAAPEVASPEVEVTQNDVTNNEVAEESKAILLLDYLSVFPEKLGEFDKNPADVIDKINQNSKYGFSDWRAPTVEELQVICANRDKVELPTGVNTRNGVNFMSNEWGTGVNMNNRSKNSGCESFKKEKKGHIILVRSN